MVERMGQVTEAPAENARALVMVAKPGGANTGVGRYVQTLVGYLHASGVNVHRTPPLVPPLPTRVWSLTRNLGLDLAAFLSNYPVWARYPDADVYHFTSQNLASLLLFRAPRGKTVVTVHDIIPYMLRDDAALCPYRGFADRLFDRLAMKGLKRADHLVADSHFTKECLRSHLGIPAERIDVVHLGIDLSRFRPVDVTEAVLRRYNLASDRHYLIYVGSEDPRKNLGTLLRALAAAREAGHDIELIKVGRAHFEQERERLLHQAKHLGIGSSVHFLDEVPEDDLPMLYNLAEICVMPSLYEGFGFPALESMACGTPVICSNAASLPELVGDAGLLFDPGSGADQALAGLIGQVLQDADLRERLSQQGRTRAAAFSWEETANRMLAVYRGFQPVSGHASEFGIGSEV